MAGHTRPVRRSQAASTYLSFVRVWEAHRAFWLLLLVVFQASPGVSRQADNPPAANHPNQQSAAAPLELVLGKPVESVLSGGQSHSYRIAMVSGQYFHVIVEQRGIDVVVALFGPDDTKLTEVDSPNGVNGRELLSWIAATSGVYRLEVRSLEKKAKQGKYEAKIDILRQATPQDSYRVRAEKSYLEGEILQAQGTAGSLRKALDKFLAALSDWRMGGEHREEASTLNSIGFTYDALGDKQKALDYYNQALPIWRQAGDRSGEAATLNNIGLNYVDLGDKQKALDYYNEALPIWQQARDRGGEAATLSNIGDVYDMLGDKQKALDYYNQALPIQQQVGDRHSEATTLNGIGIVYDALSDKQKALDYYNQALSIYRQMGDRSSEAAALNNIGGVYNDLGDKQKALEYSNQVLLIWRQAGNRRREATALSNIGSIYSALGEKQKALDSYFQALPIRRQMGDRRGLAITLNNIGSVYYNLGDKRKALDYYNQTLSIFQEVGDRSSQPSTLNNIGSVYDALGKKQQALDYFKQALTILQQVGDRRSQATPLRNISMVYRDFGKMDEALTHIEKALAIVESVRTKVTTEPLRVSYTASIYGLFEYYINLLMRLHKLHPSAGFAAAALQASERGRARSLLELLTESHADITQGVEPELLARKRAVGQVLDVKAEHLTRLLSSNHTEDQAAVAKKEVDDLTEQYQQIEAEIRDKSPRYAALTQPQPLSLEQIQNLLDPDTLLLEYSLGPERSYLWAVTQASYQSYELPKATEIEALARQFYHSLRLPEPVRKNGQTKTRAERVYTAAAAGEAEGLARKLSTMLLSPVAAMLGNKRLVVVADGALQYLPFAALADPSKRAEWEPLILRHEIVNLPSASALGIQRRELNGRNPAPKTAIVIADPVFSADDGRVKRREQARTAEEANSATNRAVAQSGALNRIQAGSHASITELAKAGPSRTGTAQADVRQNSGVPDEPLYRLELKRAIRDARPRTARDGLPRLPGTRREGEAVVALVGAGESKLIVDFAATRAAAESEEMSQYRYVLFATHGLIDSQNPKLSALVLSLVDEHGRPQNGYLRAYQIFNLNLPAEVVVLSACETGLGKDMRGEGLVGLTQGFMYAGAKHVVVSLWSVNDDSTARLMTRFYAGMLKEGKRPAEALRAAQIEMLTKRKQWRSPYYWAPFVLQGDWR